MSILTSITMVQARQGFNLQAPGDMGSTLILLFDLLNGIFKNHKKIIS